MAQDNFETTEADVCIVGLGYVGLTLATAFAEAGLTVAGVERNPEVVALISAGKSQFHEIGLDEALAAAVLGVHGEDHEMTKAVDAVELGVGRPAANRGSRERRNRRRPSGRSPHRAPRDRQRRAGGPWRRLVGHRGSPRRAASRGSVPWHPGCCRQQSGRCAAQMPLP